MPTSNSLQIQRLLFQLLNRAEWFGKECQELKVCGEPSLKVGKNVQGIIVYKSSRRSTDLPTKDETVERRLEILEI